MASEQVARLTELLADDAASAISHRLTVAEALLTLGAPAPAGAAALGAGGSTTSARIRRLIAAPAPLSRAAAAAVIFTVAALVAIPLVLAAGPAAAAATGKTDCYLPRPAAMTHVADGQGCASRSPC